MTTTGSDLVLAVMADPEASRNFTYAVVDYLDRTHRPNIADRISQKCCSTGIKIEHIEDIYEKNLYAYFVWKSAQWFTQNNPNSTIVQYFAEAALRDSGISVPA